MAKLKMDIKTNSGMVRRDDIGFWKTVYDKYTETRSLIPVANSIGVDVRLITAIFKELGFRKMSSSEARTGSIKKNYVDTKDGIKYDLDDKEFWDDIYNNKYIAEGYSEHRLSELLNISRKQLRRVFSYHKYPPKGSDDIKKTIIKSNTEIYGIERPTRDLIIKKKISVAHLNRIEEGMRNKLKDIGYDILGDYIGTREFNTGGPNSTTYNSYRIKHTECGTIFEDKLDKCPRCPNCYRLESQAEDRIRKYIESLGYETEKLKIDDGVTFKELDIYIPELNIGFEYNGTIWHSSKHKVKQNYHRDKTNLFLKSGIKIYHIWEHNDESIVRSKIKYILNKITNKLNARNLDIKFVDYIDQKIFLEGNHLFGHCTNLFSLGLYSDENLVSMISFRRRNDEIELVRFCSILDTIVRGAFERLLKHSIKHINDNYPEVHKIITFGYRDWCPDSNDSLYNKKFKFDSYVDPTLSYYKHSSRKVYNRQRFMKTKLKDIFPDVYSEDLTELEILSKKGIYAIYNSGIIKYTLDI